MWIEESMTERFCKPGEDYVAGLSIAGSSTRILSRATSSNGPISIFLCSLSFDIDALQSMQTKNSFSFR